MRHASDCATNNAPAYPAWPCDCGASKRFCPECYNAAGLLESRIAELEAALDLLRSVSKRLTDNITEFDRVTNGEFVDDVERAGIAAQNLKTNL